MWIISKCSIEHGVDGDYITGDVWGVYRSENKAYEEVQECVAKSMSYGMRIIDSHPNRVVLDDGLYTEFIWLQKV